MKKNILGTILILWTGLIFSQSNTNDNIELKYCFEEFHKLNFNYECQNNEIDKNCYVETIKIDVTKYDFNPSNYFSSTIYKLLIDGKLNAFSNSEKHLLSINEIRDLYQVEDTIITFDIKTYEERIQLEKALHLENYNCYKVIQDWILQNGKIQVNVTGLIPLKKLKSEEIDLLLIPIKTKQKNEKIINNPKIDWIKTTEEIVLIKDLKDDFIHALEEIIWENPKKGITKVFKYDFNIHVNNRQINNNEFFSYISQSTVDTIVTFDPETYERTNEIVFNDGIEFKDIVGFKIIQTWYLNSEDKTLGSNLLGMCPLIKRKGTLGELNLVPLYMVINNKLK